MWLLPLLFACSGSIKTQPDPEPSHEDVDQDGIASDEGDCDDHNPSVFPGAEEIYYDGIDQDCFAANDDDQDGDGFPLETDCDDTNGEVNPMSVEVCNGLDDDCNGEVDSDLGRNGYIDTDGDGYGQGYSSTVICDDALVVVEEGGDCDESDAGIHPDQIEHCDGVDENCNGVVDEDAETGLYTDADQDQYGDAASPLHSCTEVGSANALDCDDGDPNTHPGASERDDGLDNDCDATVDEDFVRPGDVVISELSVSPVLGDEAQWIEIRNVSSRSVILDGWTLTTGGKTLSFGSLGIPIGGTAVVCRSRTYTSAFDNASHLLCDYFWTDSTKPPDATGPGFDNTLLLSDDLSLSVASLLVDSLTRDSTWPQKTGYTLTSSASALANDVSTAWCLSSETDHWYENAAGIVEYGSPGISKGCTP